MMNQRIMLFLLLFVNFYAFSEDNVSFQLGNVGFGYNVGEKEKIEIDVTLLNLFYEFPGYFENPKARLGIEFYPVNIRILPMENQTQASFFNMNLFTDFLGPTGKFRWDYIRFGPFVSLNWLIIDNREIDFQNYILSTGLRFTLLTPSDSYLRIHFMDFEIGYKTAPYNNGFYFLVKFDFFDAILLPIWPFAEKGYLKRLFVIK